MGVYGAREKYSSEARIASSTPWGVSAPFWSSAGNNGYRGLTTRSPGRSNKATLSRSKTLQRLNGGNAPRRPLSKYSGEPTMAAAPILQHPLSGVVSQLRSHRSDPVSAECGCAST